MKSFCHRLPKRLFNNFLLGLATNSQNAEGITTRFLRTADYSLLRFPIGDAKSVEFRAEFFNLTNRVNFEVPVSNLNAAIINTSTGQIIDAGDFGRINSTSNNPRLIQFALKFNF